MGAIQVIERPQTNELRVSQQQQSLTRVFIVINAGDAVTASAAPDLPTIGSAHPDFPIAKASEYITRHEEGSVDDFEILVVYEPIDVPVGNVPDVLDPFLARITVDRQTLLVDGWRTANPASGGPPIGFEATDDVEPGIGPDGDIGGKPCDLNGQPRSIKLVQHLISVTYETFIPINEQLVFQVQNTRNQGEWRGYADGDVLYEGATSDTLPNGRITVSHRFRADQWKFLRQRPVGHASGATPLFGNSEQAVGSARYVNFYQACPFKSNFDTLMIPFPDDPIGGTGG